MATGTDKYTLIYHAGIPGRGEFPRLLLEATSTPYEDTALTVGQDAIKPYLDGTFDGSGESYAFLPTSLGRSSSQRGSGSSGPRSTNERAGAKWR